MKTREHYQNGGPSVDLYDIREAGGPGTPCDGDVEFYLRQAEVTGGPVLELACGTGRVTLPLCDAGLDVTGLDRSEHMLRVARSKLRERSGRTPKLVRGDMARFHLHRTFRLILIPYRAFHHLLTPAEQRRCLLKVRRHLRRDGRLIVHLFDPRLDLCLPARNRALNERACAPDPRTGHRTELVVGERLNDPLTQTFVETWTWTERDRDDTVMRRTTDILRLRWTYRFEMEHLFELTGFTVIARYSDFFGGAPRYGAEQIWVVSRE